MYSGSALPREAASTSTPQSLAICPKVARQRGSPGGLRLGSRQPFIVSGRPPRRSEGMTDQITAKQFHESGGVEDWRVVGDGACAFFRTGSFAAGARLVLAISELAGVDDHHPDVDLRHDGVTVRLITYTNDWYGMSRRDVELARRISGIARKMGVTADPSTVQSILFTIDARVSPEVMSFWRAVLGYEYRADNPQEDLIDPRGRGPSIWFQKTDEPPSQDNRIHVDVWVPHDQAEARIAAALAAGGRLVTDKYAPAWWTLADAEGNVADVATTKGRD